MTKPQKQQGPEDKPIDRTASLADQLRQAIVRSKMRPSHIAARLKVQPSTITRFCRGERDISLTLASQLASLLHLGWVEPDPSEITPADLMPDDSGD